MVSDDDRKDQSGKALIIFTNNMDSDNAQRRKTIGFIDKPSPHSHHITHISKPANIFRQTFPCL